MLLFGLILRYPEVFPLAGPEGIFQDQSNFLVCLLGGMATSSEGQFVAGHVFNSTHCNAVLGGLMPLFCCGPSELSATVKTQNSP